jgi:hypothetical protein
MLGDSVEAEESDALLAMEARSVRDAHNVLASFRRTLTDVTDGLYPSLLTELGGDPPLKDVAVTLDAETNSVADIAAALGVVDRCWRLALGLVAGRRLAPDPEHGFGGGPLGRSALADLLDEFLVSPNEWGLSIEEITVGSLKASLKGIGKRAPSFLDAVASLCAILLFFGVSPPDLSKHATVTKPDQTKCSLVVTAEDLPAQDLTQLTNVIGTLPNGCHVTFGFTAGTNATASARYPPKQTRPSVKRYTM